MIFEEKEFMSADGTRFLLRSPSPEDSAQMLTYLKTISAETDYMLRYPEEITMTLEDEEAFLAEKREAPRDLMIAVLREGKIVGNASLYHISNDLKARHRASFGIAITKEFWHMGLGRTLMTNIIDAAKDLCYEQLELEVASCNEKALNLYKKMGFVICGECPHAFKLKNGEYYNEYHMVLNLKEDK